jgi:phage protein U
MIPGSLGPVIFSVNNDDLFTFKGLERTRSAVFAAHQVMGGKPRLQHTGSELDAVRFTILLERFENAPQSVDARIRALLDLTDAGEQLPLVFGKNYWGLWVIERAQVHHKIFHGGLTLRGSMDLDLKEYN